MSRPDDALEILLPDADDQAVRRARDVTRFLRLLSNDAQPAQASAVGVDLERARHELERADRADLLCALNDLLRHYLSAACGPDSFAWFGEAVLDVRSAWRVLGEFELDHDWLACVPLPGESTAALVERLLTSLTRLDANATRTELWRARAAHALEGPRAGERAYRAIELGSAQNKVTPALCEQRALVAGTAECLLERGAVREARTLLFEHLARHGSDLRARQLLSWTRLLLGDAAGARALIVGLKPWLGPIPAGLSALREARPEWLPCLAGRVAGERAHTPRFDARDRTEFGAAVLAVFTFQPRVGASAIHLDAAPALRERAREWATDCSDAHEVAGSAEQRGIAEARTIIDHAGGEAGLRHAVGAAAARARALVPILDDEEEVAGWVYIECEHHLLPGPERLAALAAAWRVTVLLARARGLAWKGASEAASGEAAGDPDQVATMSGVLPAEMHSASPCARVFHDLVAALGIKLYLRRWSGFVFRGAALEPVAEGGEGVGFDGRSPGRARALARAVATGGTIAFDEPDERLALHAQAASGFVIALACEGRACGFLAVESSRRRDFKPKDIESYARTANTFGLALRVAQLCDWHRTRFHFEPWFDAARADFGRLATHLIAAARSQSVVVLAGPPGAGKLVLARWVHFESSLESGPFKVHAAGLESDGRTTLFEWLESAAGGTLVLDDVDALAPARQEELLRVLERVERATDRLRSSEIEARILATTRTGLGAARDAGRLRPDLAARLDRLTLLVPALAERREEIPALVTAMSRRFAAEEDRASPHLSDEAMALLWRQPWTENLRGLENVIYKLVLLHGGEAVEPAHIHQLARHFGLDLVRKLPSRHPRRRDLISALRTTRTAGGRANKTRAALYLGWDPDTLVARMQSEGLGEDLLQGEDAWQVHPGGGEPGAEDSTAPDADE
ncbi:MAG: sigma 54-interacting transcriptional regulator [Planctomycetes bacterium]|nr:sigma 54-interacting transcriptional regulator [Planctomycetota bacterium]